MNKTQTSDKTLAQTLELFHDLTPWTRFDEWSGICIELTQDQADKPGDLVCAFFGEDHEADFKLLILRGQDSPLRYLCYRSGEWVPEFGVDFATTNGIRVSIVDDHVESYESYRPGQPPEALRLDEKQTLFEVLDAINYLVKAVDEEKVPILGETEDLCYHLWKVSGTWRADAREFPDEQFHANEPIQVAEARLKRIQAANLVKEGVWEAASFFLPATRFQGNQEVFVQCAGIAERSMGLLGLVTLEAHADPDQELVEALIGSIEKQKRIPEFLMVKDERIAERLFPIAYPLGIHLRLRRRLKELETIREEMIDDFPDTAEENSEEQ